MNDLVFVENGQVVTDSLTVADSFEKEHKNVLKDIRELGCSEEFRRLNFEQSSYVNSQRKTMPMYYMSKKGFTLLAMGYTGKEAMKFKEAYIEQFEQMEEQLKQPKLLSEKEQLIAAMRLSIEHEEKFQEHGERITELETKVQERITLESGEQRKLQKCIAKKVYSLTEDSDTRKKLFSEIYRELRDRFGVASYKDIKSHELESAVGYVNAWIPKKTA